MAENKEKKKLVDQLNNAVIDLSKMMFGDKGREVAQQWTKQSKDFSLNVTKTFVDFTDKLLESTKLKENELIKKSSDGVKDLMRQLGFLEEDKEDDF
jgi:hypothetical protein